MKHKYFPQIDEYKKLEQKFGVYSKNIEQISYYKLKTMIDNKETFNLFIGSFWCPNCTSIMSEVVETINSKSTKVYMLDPRVGYKKKKVTDFRKCLTIDSENKLRYLSAHLELPLNKRENDTYEIKIPFITKMENGIGKKYFSEEYFKKDIDEVKSEEIKNKLKNVL